MNQIISFKAASDMNRKSLKRILLLMKHNDPNLLKIFLASVFAGIHF